MTKNERIQEIGEIRGSGEIQGVGFTFSGFSSIKKSFINFKLFDIFKSMFGQFMRNLVSNFQALI